MMEGCSLEGDTAYGLAVEAECPCIRYPTSNAIQPVENTHHLIASRQNVRIDYPKTIVREMTIPATFDRSTSWRIFHSIDSAYLRIDQTREVAYPLATTSSHLDRVEVRRIGGFNTHRCGIVCSIRSHGEADATPKV